VFLTSSCDPRSPLHGTTLEITNHRQIAATTAAAVARSWLSPSIGALSTPRLDTPRGSASYWFQIHVHVQVERKAGARFFPQVRGCSSCDTADVKILFNDDDVSPTESLSIPTGNSLPISYVCEASRSLDCINSTGPLAHFFASPLTTPLPVAASRTAPYFRASEASRYWGTAKGLTVPGEA